MFLAQSFARRKERQYAADGGVNFERVADETDAALAATDRARAAACCIGIENGGSVAGALRGDAADDHARRTGVAAVAAAVAGELITS